MQKLLEDMDRFIKNANSKDLAIKSEVVTCFDLNTALGCTLADKLESLHVSIVGASNILIKNGSSGYFWVLCSPEVLTMFDVNSKFKHHEKHEYYPMGIADKQFVGTLDKRWRVYVDPMMESCYLVIGCGISGEPKDTARVAISNFYI